MFLPPPPRSFSAGPTTQAASSREIRFDESQKAVIACPDKTIVVEAKAGAGKTTMAIGYSNARPSAKFLYLCFGKQNQVDAAARFGAHVQCRTGHSLAYQAIGHKFKDQVTFKWKTRDFAAQLNINSIRTAAIVQSVLTSFFSSGEEALSHVHFDDAHQKWDIEANELEPILAQAKLAWSKMQRVGSMVSMPPDAYLKMWVLSKPVLSAYTHIILDEAQDTNPVMVQLLEQQTHATKLIVGDRHQGIYLFRGALNAMEYFSATGATILSMPKTWRFGPDIARTANEILCFFKGEKTKIIGAGPASTQRNTQQRAVLSRTNAGLFGEAAAVLGKDTHWLGGIENYRVDILVDSFLLRTGKKQEIRDPTLRGFNSWQQYCDETERSRDGEGRMLIKLNDQYRNDIPHLVKCFKANALVTQSGARLVLATAHKAKGMDFDNVVLSEDFKAASECLAAMRSSPHLELSAELAQEINLLYVGCTRARHTLALNKDTADFLKHLDRHKNALHELRSKHSPLETVPSDAAQQPVAAG